MVHLIFSSLSAKIFFDPISYMRDELCYQYMIAYLSRLSVISGRPSLVAQLAESFKPLFQ